MTQELLYLLKVNAALAVFYGFYWLFLRKNTFYSWNRYYFLLVLPVAFLFPFINLSFLFSTQQVETIQHLTPHLPLNLSGAEYGFTFQEGILLLIVFGAGIFLIRLGIQLISLWEIRTKSTPASPYNHCSVMNIVAISNPFSFFRTIYVNLELYNKEDLKVILDHEQIHAGQWHSIDILLYETVNALCWYNPFIWLTKQAVKQNIEFYTDKQILETGYDKRSYQHELLKVSQIPSFLKIANNFNFNNLKKRITMMNKKDSNRMQLIKFALIVPLFAGMTLFANNQLSLTDDQQDGKTVKVEVQTKDDSTIAVNEMIHDFGTIKEKDGNQTAVFTLKNKGKTPLVINSVKASCGCTTPEWTKEPIAPKKEGFVKATYSVSGRIGPFDKTITVETNGTPATLVLRIKGTVEQ